MTCGCAKARKAAREHIAELFAEGKADVAARQRYGACVHATECGKMCQWLVKGVGIEQVACAHPSHDNPAPLYPLLNDPAGHCPGGLF